jgi:lipid-A-disaccharide synthase
LFADLKASDMGDEHVPGRWSTDLAMVAGETSGDLLASLLLRGLKAQAAEVNIAGIGGPHMVAQGFDAWWPSEKLAVRGYVEVLRHYREIVQIRRQLRDRLLTAPPKLFVGVDAPDFNLDLERSLKARGVPTVHFICPSVWAWRAERVQTLKDSVDHVLCIFPFEPELLARHGVPATYVGHPLAPHIPRQPDKLGARLQLGLPSDDPVVALLPGSRLAEIEHLAQRFFDAARHIKQALPRVKFVLPAVPHLKPRIEAMASVSGLGDALVVLNGQSHGALAACDVTLIASGTATLEAALFKRPMVIAYRMNWLSWEITRRKKLQPWVGLPNILCGEFVVPELLQDQAKPADMAREVLNWLAQPDRVSRVQARFDQLHGELTRDTVGLSVNVIQSLWGRS